MSGPPAGTTSRATLTGVLPLRIKGNRDGRDFARAALLLDSLSIFAAPGLFSRFIVLTPPDEVSLIADRVARWSRLPLEVMNENDVEPGLLRFPDISGWTRQQILKLAVSRHIRTSFYITFDADVICTHAMDAGLLLPGGKALIQLIAKNVVPNRLHWWRSSARILRVPKRLDEPGMAPTPAILSTDICKQLMARLDQIAAPRSWIELLVRPLRDRAWQQYIPWYKHLFRWSEYSLYYLYGQEAKLLDKHHVIAGTAETPTLLLSERCIWLERAFERFDPAHLFSAGDPALFALVQSNMELDPELVRAQVEPFLLAAGRRRDSVTGWTPDQPTMPR